MPVTVWPKPYLITIYRKAVAEGCCRVMLNGDEELYASFRAAFYRIRRRRDTIHDQIIDPAFHLCTISYEPDRGSALITYDCLPDNAELPKIESVDLAERVAQPVVFREPPLDLEALPAPSAPAPDFHSENFVNDLLEKVAQKIHNDDAPAGPFDPDEIGE